MGYADVRRKLMEQIAKPKVAGDVQLCSHPGCTQVATVSYGTDQMTCGEHSRYARVEAPPKDDPAAMERFKAARRAEREAAVARYKERKA